MTFSREWFDKICRVKHALSPRDREMLEKIVKFGSDDLLNWLPEKFASKQVQYVLLSMLMQLLPKDVLLDILLSYLHHPSDVLRLIAVMSGENGMLRPNYVRRVQPSQRQTPLEQISLAKYLSASVRQALMSGSGAGAVTSVQKSYQFTVVRMPRWQRRMFLLILESFGFDVLLEEFKRHRALWVRVGEFLHPGDYQKQFRMVFWAYNVIRKGKKRERSDIRPIFMNTDRAYLEWDLLRLYDFISIGKSPASSKAHEKVWQLHQMSLMKKMKERPEAFARHFDRILRGFGNDDSLADFVLARFKAMRNSVAIGHINVRNLFGIKGIVRDALYLVENVRQILNKKSDDVTLVLKCVQKLPTPMLIQLWGHFGARSQRLKKRIFYPRGGCRRVYWRDDTRPAIASKYRKMVQDGIAKILLERFEYRPHFEQAIVDEALSDFTFPLVECNDGGDALHPEPGSVIPMPEGTDGARLRLLVHWCQKLESEQVGLHLSLLFFDARWKLVEECTHCRLPCEEEGKNKKWYAKHSRTMSPIHALPAPYPHGASEYVDLDRKLAVMAGVRYAVMLVQVDEVGDFSALERACAGVRIGAGLAAVSEPQSERYTFEITGRAKSYIPVVLDVGEGKIYVLQCYTTGKRRSADLRNDIKEVRGISRYSIDYFRDCPKTQCYPVALMHAAARSDVVYIRKCDGTMIKMVRAQIENRHAFFDRLMCGSRPAEAFEAARVLPALQDIETPSLGILKMRDIALRDGSECGMVFEDGDS